MITFRSIFNLKNNDDYNNGVEALQKGDFRQAEISFRLAAKEKYPSALYNLALMNINGFMGFYDPNEFIQDLQLAAKVDHEGAAKELAFINTIKAAITDLDDAGIVNLFEMFLKSRPTETKFSGLYTYLVGEVMIQQLDSMTKPVEFLRYEMWEFDRICNVSSLASVELYLPLSFSTNIIYGDDEIERVSGFFNTLSSLQQHNSSAGEFMTVSQVIYTKSVVLAYLANRYLGTFAKFLGFHAFLKRFIDEVGLPE